MRGMVIIGGGQAGYSASHKLRSLGYKGTIHIICAENSFPYQRPPLSKRFLLGKIPKERLFFRSENYYKENDIKLKLGVKVTSIDRYLNKVYCSDDTELFYDKLFLVTGSTPNFFPKHLGGKLLKNYYIRSMVDIDMISNEFKPGKRVLIVGGGYIGLEVAAVAREKNLDVTLVEAENRILKRVACYQTGNFFKNLHEKNGVKIIEGKSIARLTGKNDILDGAILDTGEEIRADFSIIGIGAQPCISLAKACGLAICNGIEVDSLCQTSDNNILAAGDCANFPYRSGRLRLESVGNAIDQGETAALTAMGYSEKYNAKPWFWSDQYDTKLQIAGLSSGFDHVVERKEKKASSMWYFQNKELIAVDAINDAKAYMVAKRLLESNLSPKAENILDLNQDLKSLLMNN